MQCSEKTNREKRTGLLNLFIASHPKHVEIITSHIIPATDNGVLINKKAYGAIPVAPDEPGYATRLVISSY